MNYMRQAFKGLKKSSVGNLIALYFLWNTENLPPVVGYLSKLPVNKYSMGLQIPVASVK